MTYIFEIVHYEEGALYRDLTVYDCKALALISSPQKNCLKVKNNENDSFIFTLLLPSGKLDFIFFSFTFLL